MGGQHVLVQELIPTATHTHNNEQYVIYGVFFHVVKCLAEVALLFE